MSKANPVITISVASFGDIVVELYPNVAPNTVANFVTYVKNGFYDGLVFHRIIEGFMIQGGQGNKPLKPIKGEFESNGFDNNLEHVPGVISMARTMVKNSATSQFFIMHRSSPHLDGEYAGFGMVISGMDVVDKIAKVATDNQDSPIKAVVIDKMVVNLNGYVIPEVVYV